MITIVSSTNRADSVTLKICEQYQTLLKEKGEESQIIDLKDLPNDFIVSALYENSGKNEVFNRFRKIMMENTKFVFVVPEYNGSFPGVLKAFIDGLEYPHTFMNKKCALVGLSSGIQGGGLALSHLTDIFNYCGMHVLAQKVKLARIEANTNAEWKITNDLYIQLLQEQVDLFVGF
ncbi:MAG: chromate reductase [Cyclobacteriaceae bacterium]|jgi:chromate reductase